MVPTGNIDHLMTGHLQAGTIVSANATCPED
jgi:hypothetical protein